LHGEFEEIHSISEQLEHCPKCKEEGLEPKKVIRLIASGGNFILLGSGWGKDNYG
jgi:hypothetical protein